MKRVLIAALVVAALASCASDGKSQIPQGRNFSRMGYEALEAGHYAPAEDFLNQAIRLGQNPKWDWHNLAVVYARRSQSEPEKRRQLIEQAAQSFTMAARYGNPASQQALMKAGRPVPPPDLAQGLQASHLSQSDRDAEFAMQMLGAALEGWNAGRASASQSQQPMLIETPRINCASNSIGSSTYTNCR